MPDANEQQLPASVRRSRMLERIVADGFATVSELGERFGVSDVTIRNDLDVLIEYEPIRRVHGGVVVSSPTAERESSFEESLAASAPEKRAIARGAVDLIESGMSVILDVGTTTAALAREIVARDDLTNLTVITNGLALALELEKAIGRLQVVVTGGTLRPLQHSLVDPLASTLFARVTADIAFIGCNGVSARYGVTNVNLPEAELKRLMVASAARAVVVADGSKVGSRSLGRVAALGELSALVTGASAPLDQVRELREAGLEVLVATADGDRRD
ncbi:DeoR/GlpR family DNA-binding transcription regulator [Microbacterium sp. STN6]|uniref:DeoR/GlpR family DNA-binding transcription regulator n=1 Tax=Microbacterium sp. STN6 TaxID=2995588 RepID=UPI002260EFF0|nr:DeoR/GlpR family DNA-binding transcription regulator [Microbacterium sp. STN6]MCX7523365.1 DeoR/GlpR family DNA-binding transcription regulator [Microbacterium sp. STN6]